MFCWYDHVWFSLLLLIFLFKSISIRTLCQLHTVLNKLLPSLLPLPFNGEKSQIAVLHIWFLECFFWKSGAYWTDFKSKRAFRGLICRCSGKLLTSCSNCSFLEWSPPTGGQGSIPGRQDYRIEMTLVNSLHKMIIFYGGMTHRAYSFYNLVELMVYNTNSWIPKIFLALPALLTCLAYLPVLRFLGCLPISLAYLPVLNFLGCLPPSLAYLPVLNFLGCPPISLSSFQSLPSWSASNLP